MATLPLAVATLYAELHDLTALDRPGSGRAGGFSSKRIKGRTYWYRQTWNNGRRQQKSIGPETPELLRHIERERAQDRLWRQEQRRRRALCRALRAALHLPADPIAGRIIAGLVQGGVFAAGAVLIGTHAYRSYGPMLGAQMVSSALTTSDIDLAADEKIAVAMDQASAISLADVVTGIDPDFHVVSARPGARLSHALKLKGAETRIELLTAAATGPGGRIRPIPRLGFGAQALPYLDYLLHKSVRATYLYDAGIGINVPDPARYALHKLIVAASRPGAEQSKATKDLAQAASLIDVLHHYRAGDLKVAAVALEKSGRGYMARARKGAQRLDATARAFLPAGLRD